MTWQAMLSNGRLFIGTDMGSWRQLKNICDEHNLTIDSLTHDNIEVDDHPRRISYFIIYDKMTTLVSKQSRTRIGFGSFRQNGKARIMWRVISSNMGRKAYGNYTEVVTPKNSIWQDLSIPCSKKKK